MNTFLVCSGVLSFLFDGGDDLSLWIEDCVGELIVCLSVSLSRFAFWRHGLV